MVMPAFPTANFVVGQSGFAFGTLQAFFNAMLCFRDTCEFFERNVMGCIRHVIVCLHDTLVVSVYESNNHQDFFRGLTTLVCSPCNASLDDLDLQGAFRSVAHINLRPAFLGNRVDPCINASPGTFRRLPNATVRGRWRVQVAYQHVRGNSKQVTLAQIVQITAKRVGSSHFVISRNPGVWQQFTVLLQHFQCVLVTGLKPDFLRDSRLRSTTLVLRPFFRKVQTHINQGMLLAGNITHVGGNLTIVDFSQAAEPLTPDADRFGTRFGKTRWIEDNHTIFFTQLLSYLTHQFRTHWLIIPFRLANESLQSQTVLPEPISNRFSVLVFQVRQQSFHVDLCMLMLLATDKALQKGTHERDQTREDPLKYLGRYLAFVQQLLLPYFKSRFHAIAPFMARSVSVNQRKVLLQNNLDSVNRN